jgi:hypothetical protein
MYTNIILTLALALAMTGMQACFYSGPSHWNRQGYHDNDPRYGQYGSRHTVCDSDGDNCAVCDEDNDNCRRTASNSWFIW